MDKFDHDRAIETFRSLVAIAIAALRLLALLNGGAAVALLAYLGNIAGKDVAAPDVRLSMACYLAGLVLCGLAFFSTYLTQLRYYNQAVGEKGTGIGSHDAWLIAAMVLAMLSLIAFAVGSYCATLALA